LQDQGDEDVLFLFVGNGPGEAGLRLEAEATGLKNIRFLPSQPLELLSQSLSAGDLHLVTMRSEMAGLVVPSKFYGVMASGRPCLFVGPDASEVACVIRESGVGKVIPPEDGAALASAIQEYRAAPDSLQEAGERGRRLQIEGDAVGGLVKETIKLQARKP
jgi:glycosyltransferase involved in cell wall biosynthesis